MAKKTVFKAFVTDMFETNDIAAQPMEFTAYTINKTTAKSICYIQAGASSI